jgi:4-diphosphocytidyl-2C-methyl-D-erythritol kinase
MARVGLYDLLSLTLPEDRASAAPDTLVFENRLGEPFVEALATDSAFQAASETAEVSAVADNLALKAVSLFRSKTGYPARAVRIQLTKFIPLAAGLGGGSSDAAAVLKILNQNYPRPQEELQAMALSLGADAPFFLEDAPICWASGVGERLSPYGGVVPGRHVILVNGGYKLSTVKVFNQLGLTFGLSSSISLSADSGQDFDPAGGKTSFSAFPSKEPESGRTFYSVLPALEPKGGRPDFGVNHLEKPALSVCPSLSLTRQALSEVSPAPECLGLSGSGATYWALYEILTDAQAA